MSFYDLKNENNNGNDPKRTNTDLYSLSEVELEAEVLNRYNNFIEAVRGLGRVLNRAIDKEGQPIYNVKDIVDNLKEGGEVLDKRQKETFIKNIKADKVEQSFGVFFKDFKGRDQVDLGYKLNHVAWKLAEWREAKEVQKDQKIDYYKQFGEDYLD